VLGHDVALSIAASQGHFELNVYKPLIAHNVLDSMRLLSDAMTSFTSHCVAGIAVNPARTQALLDQSLMLVTALTPHIGYDRAAQVAKHAHARGLSLREAALAVGGVSAEDFERWVDPSKMLAPGR
jgi:fumarate hydratase, class II